MHSTKGVLMGRGLQIDYDTADRITVCCLQDQLRYLKEEIRLHVEEGQYLHPEDYHTSVTKLIPALEVLIPYYGGTL
jgi:hypothetical protein